MAGTDTDADRNRRMLRELEDRVYALESLAVRALALITGGLLLLGSVLPVYQNLENDPVPTLRLLTAPFGTFGSFDEVESRGFVATMGVGFLGLLVCIIIALGVCAAQWNRQVGPGTTRTAKVVAWLLLIGSLVPVFITVTVANFHEGGTGPAMWFFIPGSIAFAVTVFNENCRSFYSSDW